MYHIEITQRSESNELVRTKVLINTSEEYDKKINEIRLRFEDAELTLGELNRYILNGNEKETIEVDLWETYDGVHYSSIRQNYFMKSNDIVKILAD